MMAQRLFFFRGGSQGPWKVTQAHCLVGEPLPNAPRLSIGTDPAVLEQQECLWVLRGITSNVRYVNREEKAQLVAVQEGLGRPNSIYAALIPIRKTAAWWELTQDQRREIFEEQSHHIQEGLKYLPPIARQLHHCRDLSEKEPFDFLTWFEYAPSHEEDFNQMLAGMRASEEWKYVDREIDIRLVWEEGTPIGAPAIL